MRRGRLALDLFRGEMTREHEDLEIAVSDGQFGLVREALADFDIEVIGSGHRWPLDSPAFDVMAQTWVRERDTGVYRLDIFREPHDGDTWIRRPKYQADFTGVLPLLNPARRAWLAAALARVHPGHPWISELQGRA